MSKPFRTAFPYDKTIFWYPQHQSRALRQLKDGVHHIDLVVEVRDARLPLTSINLQFDNILGRRERIVVYNKCDLANQNLRRPLSEALQKYRGEQCIFTTADKGLNVQKILDVAIQKCKANPVRYPYLSLVVVGMPNVGKSTIINGLRRLGVNKGKVTAVGKTPGITQAIQTRVKIYDNPPIYLVDTPGIYDPHVSSPVQGLKISIAGSTKEKFTAIINVADYLLFRLNTSKLIHSYPPKLGLKEPTDEIYTLLEHIARTHQFYIVHESRIAKLTPRGAYDTNEDGRLDVDRAARFFLDQYRDGLYGPMTLDICTPEALVEWFSAPVVNPREINPML